MIRWLTLALHLAVAGLKYRRSLLAGSRMAIATQEGRYPQPRRIYIRVADS
jgi:hypothetical protein